ncbi:MAG TPA: ATP-grasp domain-containing protein [Polyangiaceae bacterium]|nr:ATP-grasp domain-containing protein [Polyangiaceae bacterium]
MNGERPRVLIVGCGFPQLGLLRAAKELGLFVVGTDANPSAIGRSACDRFFEASTHDVDAIVSAARQADVLGITTCGSEVALKSTVQAALELGLPFYGDSATVERCQAKDLMRDAYRAGGAPIPAFVSAASFNEASAFVSREGLPVVVKPSRGWGQRGVSKVEHAPELRASYDRAREASSTGIVLVEEFIDGREFSVNAYTHAGKTEVFSVTERIITHYPDPPGITFAEWYPAGLGPADKEDAVRAALLGVRALGIRRGPTYTQLRVGPDGARIVETAYRLGGGLDPDVALLASGVSLFRKILGVALGKSDWEAAGPEKPAHGGAIGKFIVGKPGSVVRIEGLDEARALPGVVAAEVYVGVGGTVFPLTDGSKRAGHVLAHGRDRAEAEARAKTAVDTIRIVTE